MNKKDFGLYRDDGLGILRNTSGPEADRKHESIIKIFKEFWLSITCEVNKKIVDFLDVRFNLNQQTLQEANQWTRLHQHTIKPSTKHNSISKRLTNISCNKNVFDRNVDIYQTALKNSDFDRKITYNNQSEQASNVNTNVNVLFFGTTHPTLWMWKRI